MSVYHSNLLRQFSRDNIGRGRVSIERLAEGMNGSILEVLIAVARLLMHSLPKFIEI